MSLGGTSRSRYYNPEQMLKYGTPAEKREAERVLASRRYSIVPGYNKGGYQVVSREDLKTSAKK